MDFSEALKVVKAGGRVRLRRWKEKGMFIFFVDEKEVVDSRVPWKSVITQYQELIAPISATMDKYSEIPKHYHHIVLFTPKGRLIPYQPSSSHMLAEDWEIVET